MNVGIKQLLVTTDFHSIEKILRTSMATRNGVVTNILQVHSFVFNRKIEYENFFYNELLI